MGLHLAQGLTMCCVLAPSVSKWSRAALRQLMAPHGWGNPARRVNTPASPVLPLEGAGRIAPSASGWGRLGLGGIREPYDHLTAVTR